MSADSHFLSTDDQADLNALCAQLEELTPQTVDIDDWPAHQLRLLGRSGFFAWGLPSEFGGREASETGLLAAYARLAAACLTTTFIVTQRSGACQRIAASANRDLKAELLPPLCSGDSFATVGISHLTTSRQHLSKPAVSAVERPSGYVLNGTVPWVTGARFADTIVTGGTLADGRQVLLAVPRNAQGLTIKDPLRLLALSASHTTNVELNDVVVPHRCLLAGPVEHVMRQGAGGSTGSLTTSSLAIGMTRGVLGRLSAEAQRRPDLEPIWKALERECDDATAEMYAAALKTGARGSTAPTSESVRHKANSLVLRTAQAYLAASKGAGFVSGHPAERAVREAMFFLVWSCPQPVLAAALREFACVIDEG